LWPPEWALAISWSYQGHAVDLTRPWDRLSVSEAFLRLWWDDGRSGTGTRLLRRDYGHSHRAGNSGLSAPCFSTTTRPAVVPWPGSSLATRRWPSVSNSISPAWNCAMPFPNSPIRWSSVPVSNRREPRPRRPAERPSIPSAEPFLQALASMPPAAGNALGLDRLVMLFTDAASIDEVVAFTPEEL
jgi:lysyl-tRNA synthetase class 2